MAGKVLYVEYRESSTGRSSFIVQGILVFAVVSASLLEGIQIADPCPPQLPIYIVYNRADSILFPLFRDRAVRRSYLEFPASALCNAVSIVQGIVNALLMFPSCVNPLQNHVCHPLSSSR